MAYEVEPLPFKPHRLEGLSNQFAVTFDGRVLFTADDLMFAEFLYLSTK